MTTSHVRRLAVHVPLMVAMLALCVPQAAAGSAGALSRPAIDSKRLPRLDPARQAELLDPRILEVLAAPGTVELQNASVTIGVHKLPLGSRVRPTVDFRAHARRSCTFVPRPTVSYGTVSADARGRASVTMSGWFGRRFARAGQEGGSNVTSSGAVSSPSCGLVVTLDVILSDGRTERRTLDYPDTRLDDASHQAIVLSPRVRRQVRDTWDWQRQFGFRNLSGVGACAGKALGFGFNKDFDVGVLRSAGDISFRIRTGPIGTRCSFGSVPLIPGNGVNLVGMDVRVQDEGTGKCRVEGAGRFSRGVRSIGAAMAQADPDFRRGTINITAETVFSDGDPVMTEDQVILSRNDRRLIRMASVPFSLDLVCDATLKPSEGGIRVTITNLYFAGPSGADLSP